MVLRSLNKLVAWYRGLRVNCKRIDTSDHKNQVRTQDDRTKVKETRMKVEWKSDRELKFEQSEHYVRPIETVKRIYTPEEVEELIKSVERAFRARERSRSI